MSIKCPRCGKENDGKTDFCIYCGTKFDEYKPDNDLNLNLFNFNKSNSEDIANSNQNFQNRPPQKNYNLAIVLGYIFSILGGLIGLVIAIYLITRKNQNAKKHGKIQLAIFAVYIMLIIAFIATGALTVNQLLNPFNMTNTGNITNITDINNLTSFFK